ncbi:MAG: N-acetyltransferase [Prevotella sp.]|jgi:predicted N-acetyltransferase YhbS|nr:N-acetyltransferase [Prevotella sp.]
MNDNEQNAQIRQERAQDFPAVYNIHVKAFSRIEEARLTDRLRSSDAFIPELSLVAIIENEIVGHILFTKVSIEHEYGQKESLSLAPMAVRPDTQRKGVGTKLIQAGFEKARQLGYKSVIVLGHPEYYTKFGFKPTSNWDIKPPFNVPNNAFMGMELIEDAFGNMKGIVQYPKEFQEI